METTTSTRHTPGPWTVSRDNKGMIPEHFRPPIILARDGNMTLADGLGNGPEAEANARLIAAAPELLASCHQLVATCDGLASNGVVLPLSIVDCYESARAAIANATGGAQ